MLLILLDANSQGKQHLASFKDINNIPEFKKKCFISPYELSTSIHTIHTVHRELFVTVQLGKSLQRKKQS